MVRVVDLESLAPHRCGSTELIWFLHWGHLIHLGDDLSLNDWESMHLLAPTDEGYCFVISEISQSHLSCVGVERPSPISWPCRSDIGIFFAWTMSFFSNALTIVKKLSVKWVNPVTPNLLGYYIIMNVHVNRKFCLNKFYPDTHENHIEWIN